MRTLAVAFSLLLFRTALSQGIWMPTGPMSQGNNDIVYSVTADPDGNLYASSWTVGVYKSTNSGLNWFLSGLAGKRVSFIASSPSGLLFALSKTVDSSFIHRSTDQGATWTDADRRSFPLNYAGGGGIVFLPDGSITAAYSVTVGPTIGNVGVFVFRSTDEGASWQQTVRMDLGFVGGMALTKDGKILMGTSLSGVIRSTNGGLSFTNLTSFPPIFIKTVLKAPDNSVYVSDAFGLHRSRDNGASFTSVGSQNSTANLRSAAANSNGDLFISTDDGKIFLSTNRGDNWAQVNSGFPSNSYAYSFTSLRGRMFTGSNNSGVFSFEQTTGFSVSTSLPAGYSLGQNYPNPFNPATAIPFSIARESLVELIVYDAGGKKVATLANGKVPAGSHVTHFNAGNLPSGIYFYSLFADGERADTKKCFLVK
ncbi:MAG: T9SS type A sorting domain-containing protein [Ignavibacteria bacterium]|nr:T9SS type A sorting domain-containing protein [Ignavibacteria bacterium]